jgi:uncharacterized protein YbjT (DUF2867 family)
VQCLITTTESQHTRKAYNITGGEALSYGQAAEILSKEIGKRVNYVNISSEDACKGMKGASMDEWTISSEVILKITPRYYSTWRTAAPVQ